MDRVYRACDLDTTPPVGDRTPAAQCNIFTLDGDLIEPRAREHASVSCEDAPFWFASWQEGRIGFHEGAPNRYLVEHAEWLSPCRRILVPLCGKSEDLAYLAGRGHEVIGIELVSNAVTQFFTAQGVTPTVETRGDLAVHRAGSITIIAGDVFAVTAAHVGAIDGIFDRAALVALPPDTRRRYIEHLRSLTPAARRELLVSIEYPAEAISGPPFSVEEPEVRAHFVGADVQVVGGAAHPQGRLEGRMFERCYTIAW